jgi:predicted nucleic acid-binding protein
LAVFHCEPVPERAGDLYAAVKLARQQRGLSLDENDLWVAATALALGATLVSRDNDFKSIDGLPIVAWRSPQVPLCKAYVRGDDDTLM